MSVESDPPQGGSVFPDTASPAETPGLKKLKFAVF